jgi:hypothetical protein
VNIAYIGLEFPVGQLFVDLVVLLDLHLLPV